MMQKNVKTINKSYLPARLMKALEEVAEKYDRKGLILFIFGSFARSKQRKTSDLDIGVLWKSVRNPKMFTELYQDIQQLPTIRKIDLVDMHQVDKDFRKKAVEEGVMLFNK